MSAKRTLRALTAGAVMALAVGAAVPPAIAEPADPYADSIATTYQMNAAHDGNSPLGAPPPPLDKLWSRAFKGQVSYAVVAAGRVFVTVANPQDFSEGYGTRLYALDARTGEESWPSVQLGGSAFWSNLTFGDGLVFAINYDGQLRAFDAVTGTIAWQRTLGSGINMFTAPPTFRDGVVYVGASGSSVRSLYAVRAATGSTMWSRTVYDGGNSSPAVDDDGVYVSYNCGLRFKMAPATGAVRWWYPYESCSSSGGRTPVIAAGRVWIRDPGPVAGYSMSPEDGRLLDRFADGTYRVTAPAFLGDTGFFLDDGVLRASHAATPATPIWTFTGDGRLSSAPIVVNGHVYVGSARGQLWALDPTTGVPVWSTNVGASINDPDERSANPPLTGLTAGQGRLLVPADKTLTAYGQ